MVEVKNNFSSGLDLDTDYYQLPLNAFVNGLNITTDAVAGSSDKVITNIVGNRLVNYTYHAGGTPKTIGACPNPLRKTAIEFAWHPTGYHAIVEYNNVTRVRTKIFENLTDSAGMDILGFTQYDKITGVNILNRDEGDLLFFLDSLGRPTVINISHFKIALYTPVTRDIIDVARRPPLSPPAASYANDATRRSNDLRKRLFRFKCVYVYNDNERSAPSPISAVPLPASILDDTFTSVITNNNKITLTLASGSKQVKEIEILVSYQIGNGWSDFLLVESVNKVANSIGNNTTFTYNFFNDSTYPAYDINHSLLPYDYVPDFAKAQEMPNGNVLMYGAITEGYDKTIVPNVVNTVGTIAAGSAGSIGTLSAAFVDSSEVMGFRYESYGFSGTPATGTLVQIRVRRRSDGAEFIASSYTTVGGSTADSVVTNLITNNTESLLVATHPATNQLLLRFATSTYEPLPSTGYWAEIIITPPATSSAPNSTATFPFSRSKRIGISYFDQKGKTNGIMYDAKITFPAYSESGGGVLVPYINTKIYHLPPTWAYSFQFLFTKEPDFYLYWMTQGVKKEPEYIYFDVSNFSSNQIKRPTTSAVLDYKFQDGDRLRLIKRISDGNVFADTYDAGVEGLVVDPKINGTVEKGEFIKIKNIAPFTAGIGTAENYVIEIYRPTQQTANKENQVFYEFGRQYPIILDSIGVPVHGGQITNQETVGNIPAEFNFYEGDAYFRQRITYTPTGYHLYNVLDRNFVDTYISAVNSIDGRPSIIDVNARKAYYPTMVRFGQAYQTGTNINGLGRFYPNNFDEYDVSFGDIMRLKVRDRQVRVFQKYKVGSVPLFSQLTKDTQGNSVQVVTDKLINPINYYAGDFGIGENPESLASANFADYFCDTRGFVCRVSNDGVTPLSVVYKIDSFASVEIPKRTGNYKIYGAFYRNKYVIAMEATAGDAAYTFSFDEKANHFEPQLSFNPEWMTNLGTQFITWKNGQLYTHDSTTYNNFYGTQYSSFITLVFNQNINLNKSFMSLEERANVVWECPSIITSLMSYGTTPQTSNLIAADLLLTEGRFSGSFLRDINSLGVNPLVEGDFLKGNWIKIKFQITNPTTLVSLSEILLHLIESPPNG